MRPSFLDDLSATQAGRGARACARSTRPRGRQFHRAGVLSHQMSLEYALEYPVEDPDDDEDDDFDEDEDEDGDEDEDDGDPEQETWQVSNRTVPLKDALCLTSPPQPA
jgi:hypothetical protein